MGPTIPVVAGKAIGAAVANGQTRGVMIFGGLGGYSHLAQDTTILFGEQPVLCFGGGHGCVAVYVAS